MISKLSADYSGVGLFPSSSTQSLSRNNPPPSFPRSDQETVTISSTAQRLLASREDSENERIALAASAAGNPQLYSFNENSLAHAQATETAVNGSAEPIEYRNIAGINIIVSGHQYDTSIPGRFSINQQNIQNDFTAWLEKNPEKTFRDGVLQSETVPITESERWLPPESIGWDSLFVLDGGVSIEQQIVDKAEDLAIMLQAVKQLSQEYGSSIKLAKDTNTDNYIMLKAGDNFYDDVQTGEEALADFKKFLFNSGHSSTQIAQIFEKHGVYF